MSGRVFSGLGFHQNIGRDTGFESYPRSEIGQNLARIRVGKEKVFEIAHEISSGCGILVKKRAGMRDQDPPLQTLALAIILEAGPGGEDPPTFLRPQLNFLACMLCFPNSDHVILSREFPFCLFKRYAFICAWK